MLGRYSIIKQRPDPNLSKIKGNVELRGMWRSGIVVWVLYTDFQTVSSVTL